jgi:hypothetical protein
MLHKDYDYKGLVANPRTQKKNLWL